jgi:hypothetical protein
MYPGSYIHIAPSFYIPEVVYIDSFKKTNSFFNDERFRDVININKIYKEEAIVRYHFADYSKKLPEKLGSFDLLISQYAGFVSQCCKKYLKREGILVANNSHNDAGMALVDESFEFIGVIYYSQKHYRLTQRNLEKYFIPKRSEVKMTKKYIKKHKKTIGYTKTASAYIFKKI